MSKKKETSRKSIYDNDVMLVIKKSDINKMGIKREYKVAEDISVKGSDELMVVNAATLVKHLIKLNTKRTDKLEKSEKYAKRLEKTLGSSSKFAKLDEIEAALSTISEPHTFEASCFTSIMRVIVKASRNSGKSKYTFYDDFLYFVLETVKASPEVFKVLNAMPETTWKKRKDVFKNKILPETLRAINKIIADRTQVCTGFGPVVIKQKFVLYYGGIIESLLYDIHLTVDEVEMVTDKMLCLYATYEAKKSNEGLKSESTDSESNSVSTEENPN